MTVVPFPSPRRGAAPAVAAQTEITPTVSVVLYSDGCAGVTVYEPEVSPDGTLGVVAAEPLEAHEAEAMAGALLSYAAALRAGPPLPYSGGDDGAA